MKVQSLNIKVDSKLVAKQINEEYMVAKENMIWYLAKAKEPIKAFKKFTIQNIPRNQNHKADVLRKIAFVAFNHLTKEILVEVLYGPLVDSWEIAAIMEEEGDNLMTPIVKCLKDGICLEDPNEARSLLMKINQYVIEDGVLFKKSYLLPMLRTKASQGITNVCHGTMALLPIGLDILGPLPEGPGNMKFIILAIDYFTKCMEVKPLAKITRKEQFHMVSDNVLRASPRRLATFDGINPNTSQGYPGRTCPTSLAGAVEYYQYPMRMTEEAYRRISQGSPDHPDVPFNDQRSLPASLAGTADKPMNLTGVTEKTLILKAS
ncbi:reverse transcriptase domain-containing protein [Tanacetum coccineum]